MPIFRNLKKMLWHNFTTPIINVIHNVGCCIQKLIHKNTSSKLILF